MPLRALLRRILFLNPAVILTVNGVLALGLLVVVGLAMVFARESALREADRRALTIAYAAGQEIGGLIEQHDRRLRGTIRKLQKLGSPDLVRQQSGLFAGASQGNNFAFTNILNESGDVIADSGNAERRNRNWGNRDYFRMQRDSEDDEPFIGKPFSTAEGLLGLVPLSRRWTHSDGTFAGVVVGMMRLPAIAEILGRFRPGQRDSIVVVRNDGMMLQRWPAAPRELGTILHDLRLRVPIFSPRDMDDPIDQVHRRFVLAPVQGFPLSVEVGLSYSEIFSAWRVEAAMMLLPALAMALLNIGLSATLYARLRNASAAESDHALYLGMMGHEVRGRVQTMFFCTEAILRGGAPVTALSEHYKVMSSECSHLHDVLDRLFDYTRLKTRGDTAEYQEVDITSLIQQCESWTSWMAAAKNVTTEFQIDRNVPLRIVTDAGRLRTILKNLLENAIKYTNVGSITCQVSLEEAGVLLKVMDTGVGIPENLRHRLSRPHDRLDHEGWPNGTGLGLFIAERLVRQIGGRLNYTPNLPKGSIFWLRLPLNVPDGNESASRQAALASSTRQPCPASVSPDAIDSGQMSVLKTAGLPETEPQCDGGLQNASVTADKKREAVTLSRLRGSILAVQPLVDSLSPSADGTELAGALNNVARDAAGCGFMTLAEECRRYQHSVRSCSEWTACRDSLSQAIKAALTELAQRFQEPRNGEGRSDIAE